MPKIVDADERRREIAEALWRLAMRQGLEAASLSAVAAEAGVSKGRLQHYFASREEMLLFAVGYANERLDERVRRRLAEQTDPRPMAAVRALVLALLPVDEESRTGALVNVAFFIRALATPALSDTFRRGSAELLRKISGYLREARESGEFAAGLDVEQEAKVLLALAGGLSSGMLMGGTSAEEATATLDHHLARLRP
ncbi:TetR/AcrR family transcriptional regulator [Bailinhaonella thermotolerans]|uniref:TetR family transcriptional regulator n=1 Tax=Bailinhaonella thermotolerans TaxID=1070861 RepID=A0A3A4BB25_9ACTN|nr:TetR/AcrR family transcriptional regulator [Bailinhaonella thermotolerans]RJL35783.1 TetR family transcriptional regulator [Bailinhaonella thermotolerans]